MAPAIPEGNKPDVIYIDSDPDNDSDIELVPNPLKKEEAHLAKVYATETLRKNDLPPPPPPAPSPRRKRKLISSASSDEDEPLQVAGPSSSNKRAQHPLKPVASEADAVVSILAIVPSASP